MMALDVPYFVCVPCRTICINKEMVHRAIRTWNAYRHHGMCRVPPHRVLYQEMLTMLNEFVDDDIQRAGYRCTRFTKIVP
jgi:hypothetical protein